MRPVPTLDSSFVNRVKPTANSAYHIQLLLGKRIDVIVILSRIMRCLCRRHLSGSVRAPLSDRMRTRASREPQTEAAAVALGRRLVFTLTERNFTTPGPQRRGSQAPPILSSAGEGRSPRRSRGLRSHDHAVRRLMWGPACGGAADIGSPRPRATHYLRWQLIRLENPEGILGLSRAAAAKRRVGERLSTPANPGYKRLEQVKVVLELRG